MSWLERDRPAHDNSLGDARAGRYVLINHALSRAERGLGGFLIVDGPQEDAIMHAGPVD
jgi:hypothetical protein